MSRKTQNITENRTVVLTVCACQVDLVNKVLVFSCVVSHLAAQWKPSLDCLRRLSCSWGFGLRADNALKAALSHLHCFLIHAAPPKPRSLILAFLQHPVQVINTSIFACAVAPSMRIFTWICYKENVIFTQFLLKLLPPVLYLFYFTYWVFVW